MATSSIALHQKKLEFEDNQFLSSLFGYHDKNLKVLEDKFKVKLYSRGNLLSIKGNRDPVEKAYFIIQGLYQKLKNCSLWTFWIWKVYFNKMYKQIGRTPRRSSVN